MVCDISHVSHNSSNASAVNLFTSTQMQGFFFATTQMQVFVIYRSNKNNTLGYTSMLVLKFQKEKWLIQNQFRNALCDMCIH
jgi:hypothetical protein